MRYGINTCDSLSSDRVRLEYATLDHAEAIYRVGDPETFRLMAARPSPWSDDGCRAYLHKFLEDEHTVQYSAFDQESGELVGGTSYYDIRPMHRGLEIGSTWVAPQFRRRRFNAEMKLLMLGQAFDTDVFEDGPAIRVMLKTHHKNNGSQRSIESLGAKKEGVLRNHMIMPDGSIRHTVVYSVTSEDWPNVKRDLLTKLAR